MVGIPSILALCSASFLAIRVFSSSALSGLLALSRREHRMREELWFPNLCYLYLNVQTETPTSATSCASSPPFSLSAPVSDSLPQPGCPQQWPGTHSAICLGINNQGRTQEDLKLITDSLLCIAAVSLGRVILFLAPPTITFHNSPFLMVVFFFLTFITSVI